MSVDADEDEADFSVEALPWSWVGVAGVVAMFGSNVSRAVAGFWEDVSAMCGQRARVGEDRAAAYAAMHADLESLPVVEE